MPIHRPQPSLLLVVVVALAPELRSLPAHPRDACPLVALTSEPATGPPLPPVAIDAEATSTVEEDLVPGWSTTS
jgi:hypothetical protein